MKEELINKTKDILKKHNIETKIKMCIIKIFKFVSIKKKNLHFFSFKKIKRYHEEILLKILLIHYTNNFVLYYKYYGMQIIYIIYNS